MNEFESAMSENKQLSTTLRAMAADIDAGKLSYTYALVICHESGSVSSGYNAHDLYFTLVGAIEDLKYQIVKDAEAIS